MIIKNINKDKNISLATIFISIIIIISGLLINSSLIEYSNYLIYLLIGIYGIVYFIIEIIKKENISIEKIDIFLLILVFSNFIPLILKTSVNISETAVTLLKNFTALIMYFIVKNECRKNQNTKDLIINIIIFIVLFFCIIGLDENYFNIFDNFREFMKYHKSNLDEKRITSIFVYPNAFATVIASTMFILIGKILNNKNKKNKLIYITILLIFLITFILTYSRLTYIFLGFFVLAYILLLGKKYNIREKVNKKHICIIIGIIIISICYYIIGLNIASDLNISNTQYQKIMYTVESNKEYKFDFYISTQAENETDINIQFIEKNMYFDDVNIINNYIGKENGKKTIVIKTTPDTSVIYIRIKVINNAKLNISDTKLNDSKYILKYKLLPTNVVDKVKSISLKNKSAWERFEFINNAMKIIKDNWLFGAGADCWRVLQSKTQSYNYYAGQVHCHPLKLWMDNGIIAIISYLLIMIEIIKSLFYEIKKENMDINNVGNIFALAFIQVHSFLDFDMSFQFIQLISWILIAMIQTGHKKEKSVKRKFMTIILVIISILTIYISSINYYYYKNSLIVKVNEKWTEERIFDIYNKLLPLKKSVKYRRYKAIRNSNSIDKNKSKMILKQIINIDKYSLENVQLININKYVSEIIETNDEDELEWVYKYLVETQQFYRYNVEIQLNRFSQINNIIDMLEKSQYSNQKYKFKNQLNKEIEDKKQYFLDYNKCRYNKEKLVIYQEQLDNIVKQ